MTLIKENKQKKILIVEDQFVEAYDLQIIIKKKGYHVIGIARSFKKAIEIIKDQKPDLVLLDIFLKGKETGIDLARMFQKDQIGFIYISANASQSILDIAKRTQPHGFIIKPFREQEILTTIETYFYRHQQSSPESKIIHQNLIPDKIQEIIDARASKDVSILELGKMLQSIIPFYFLEIHYYLNDAIQNTCTGLLRKNIGEYIVIDEKKMANIAKLPIQNLKSLRSDCINLDENFVYVENKFWDTSKSSPYIQLMASNLGMRSFVTKNIKNNGNITSRLTFYSRNTDSYSCDHLAELKELDIHFLKFEESILKNHKQIKASKNHNKLEIPQVADFEGLIGSSPKMLMIYDHIRKVAKTETSVLILGESGTGKEKIASCIHNLSLRRDAPLVIVNCGAIPDNFAESVLFGHENGSFTGAIAKRIGKFEQAQGGTLFLDEIGEMSMEVQIKLLRVLQEREIEPIGCQSPIKINVRVIAATNTRLEEAVAAGKFRLDLYYRLYIFPIHIPSLRDRKEDIPALAEHFVLCNSNKLGNKIPSISKTAYKTMMAHNWPGNIRELEYVIQRSLLLTEGNSITNILITALPTDCQKTDDCDSPLKTLTENERDYILSVLKRCNGKVSGIGGAAEVLGVPHSTLTSKMKKLGIK